MGVIRKTLSIGTLGAVSFRSKKEKLRRAERSQRGAEIALATEHSARVAAEDRISRAEKRLKRANAEAAQAALRLEEAKRRDRRGRRARRKDRAAEVRATLEPMVRSGVENVRHASADATKRGRKAGRRARKVAQESLERAQVTVTSAKDAAAPHAERLAARAGDAIDQLTTRDS